MLRIIGPLRMQERVESKEGKRMKGQRMATVEPVFGSLLNYYGMKRSNAKGKQAAHKFMLLAATAYNLQKLLFCSSHPRSNVQIFTQKQVSTLQFGLFYVVQHPGGIDVFTRNLALELGPRGITVNSIAPVAVSGGSTMPDSPQMRAYATGIAALGCIETPEDIGGIAAFLCGEEAGWINGQRIEATGGVGL